MKRFCRCLIFSTSFCLSVGLLASVNSANAQSLDESLLDEIAGTRLDDNISCQPNCPNGYESNNPDLTYDPEDQRCVDDSTGEGESKKICVKVIDEDGEQDGHACCNKVKTTQAGEA